ncbi:hypothetical protein GGR26_002193 [Lewinella marina]|nr:hypothetical protein [Neolewinella marina]NJB86425.1 hypothetical protein [Neolewinella marina]
MYSISAKKYIKLLLIIAALGIIGNLLYYYSGLAGHEFGHWWYGNAADH